MKPTKSSAIVLTLVGILFLVPTVKRAIDGEPLSFTPGVAAAVGVFLCAVVHFSLFDQAEVRWPFRPAQCLTRAP